ncbi:hypothetical protein [Rhodococcus erythropolis]|uniref:hypothetical protein n=1 Tax=Rhodococcus erythropolis TaxID=1833 RepID=UPI003671E058
MTLSRLAREFSAEIKQHDWSDAPWRIDRAGHTRAGDSKSRSTDKVLTTEETDRLRWNVVLVTAQVLMHSDPNLDLTEFAIACGLPPRLTGEISRPNGSLKAGIRMSNDEPQKIARPGSWDFDE